MGYGSLPEGWNWTTIGEIVTFEYGKGLKKSIRHHNGNVPVYGSNGVVGMHSKALVEKPCLIIGRKGTAGAVHMSKTSCWPIDTTYFVIPSKNLDLSYLFYLFTSLNLSSLDKSTAIPGLNRNDAYKVNIPLPPLSEQEHIVAKIEELFSQLDAGTAALKRVQTGLKRYKASVLKAAVEGRLLDPQNQRLGEGELPEGWKWTTVGEIGDVSGGITKNSKRDSLQKKLPYLRVANVYANELRLTEISRIGVEDKEINRALLKDGDLLVVEGNGSPDQIGRVAIWNGSIFPCLHQNHIIKVRFQPKEIAEYVLFWLLSDGGRKQINRVASSTSGLYTLNLTKISKLSVPLPPLEEQQQIVEEIEHRFSMVKGVEKEVEAGLVRAERLRQSVLKSAFEGRLM